MDDIARRGKNIPDNLASDNRQVGKHRLAPIASRIMASLGVATSEIVTRADTYKLLEYLMSCNMEQLEAIITNPITPVSVLTFAEGIKADMKKGKIDTVSALMERIYGKASQKIELDTNPEKETLPAERFKTRADYMKYLSEISAEMGFVSDALDVAYEEVKTETANDSDNE